MSIVIGLTGKIDNLPQNVGSTVEFRYPFQVFLHIDSYHDVGSHSFGYVYRIVVYHSAIDKYHTVFPYRRENFGNRHAGAQDRKSTRLNSSHANISHDVFCLKKHEGVALLGGDLGAGEDLVALLDARAQRPDVGRDRGPDVPAPARFEADLAGRLRLEEAGDR